MKRLDAKGFSAIEGLLLLIVVAIIGGTGYFVLNAQKKTNTTLENTSKSQGEVSKSINKTEKAKVTPASNWFKYTSQNKKYTVSLPDGWNLSSMKGEDNMYAWEPTSIIYSEGKAAEVTVIDGGGRDGSSMAFNLVYDTDTHFEKSASLKKVKSYTTTNKVNVSKSSRTQTGAPDETIMDIPKGTTEYVYVLTADGRKITIVQDVLAGGADQSQRIEQLIETLKFL